MDGTNQIIWKKSACLASIFTVILFASACDDKRSPNAPTLGKTFAETEAMCGHGKIEGVNEYNSKLVVYTHLAGATAKAAFFDDVARIVWYDIGAKNVEDKQLQYYLELNAQGHKWTLVDAATDGWLTAHWTRDDGGVARCGGKDGPFLYIAGPVPTK